MTDDPSTSLERRRTELLDQLADLEQPGAEAGGISFGKRVGEGTSVAVERLSQVAVHDRLREILADVVRAQTKLTDGTYGSCDSCGVAIGAERPGCPAVGSPVHHLRRRALSQNPPLATAGFIAAA